MPKYWGKQIFTHGRFHEVGQTVLLAFPFYGISPVIRGFWENAQYWARNTGSFSPNQIYTNIFLNIRSGNIEREWLAGLADCEIIGHFILQGLNNVSEIKLQTAVMATQNKLSKLFLPQYKQGLPHHAGQAVAQPDHGRDDSA